MVGKLHALAPLLRPPLALHLALEDLAAEHIERIEPGHKLGVQQLSQLSRCRSRAWHRILLSEQVLWVLLVP
jgi:hypothetical protein